MSIAELNRKKSSANKEELSNEQFSKCKLYCEICKSYQEITSSVGCTKCKRLVCFKCAESESTFKASSQKHHYTCQLCIASDLDAGSKIAISLMKSKCVLTSKNELNERYELSLKENCSNQNAIADVKSISSVKVKVAKAFDLSKYRFRIALYNFS